MQILVVNNSEDPKDTSYVLGVCTELKTDKVIHYKDLDLETANRYDGIVLGGATIKGNLTSEERLPFYKWLLSYNKPVLGICAGHHILGLLNNSKYIKHKQPTIGERRIHLTANRDELIGGVDNGDPIYEKHMYHISLPDNYVLLAYSFDKTVEIMKHKSKRHYGVQFHPEKSLKIILNNFKRIIGAKKG